MEGLGLLALFVTDGLVVICAILLVAGGRDVRARVGVVCRSSLVIAETSSEKLVGVTLASVGAAVLSASGLLAVENSTLVAAAELAVSISLAVGGIASGAVVGSTIVESLAVMESASVSAVIVATPSEVIVGEAASGMDIVLSSLMTLLGFGSVSEGKGLATDMSLIGGLVMDGLSPGEAVSWAGIAVAAPSPGDSGAFRDAGGDSMGTAVGTIGGGGGCSMGGEEVSGSCWSVGVEGMLGSG